MTKILLEIPDKIYDTIDYDMFISREQLAVLQKHILEGTLLPYNATNGDVIKALFPKVKIHQSGGYTMALFQPSTYLEDTRSEWWNAPYEVNDGETL